MVLEGVGNALSPFAESGIGILSRFSWVLWFFVPLAAVVVGIIIWRLLDQKKKQWTHKLKVRRVLQNGSLTDPGIIRMRRFPLIRSGEVFELEHSLLGSYLIPELDSYTGENEYSIIIDTNNRIYTNKGEKFIPDKESVEVSAKHSEIDISLGDFKQKYQQVHQTKKLTDWAKIGKFALLGLLIIAVMVIAIKGIEQWGKNHEADAQKSVAEAEAYTQLKEALEVIDGTVNTQAYILEQIKEIEGTENIQGIIREATNEG